MFQKGIDDIITPNMARTLRRETRECFAHMREIAARARMLLNQARVWRMIGKNGRAKLAREDAQGIMVMEFHSWHIMARRNMHRLAESTVQKYANVSVNAAKRLEAFHANR